MMMASNIIALADKWVLEVGVSAFKMRHKGTSLIAVKRILNLVDDMDFLVVAAEHSLSLDDLEALISAFHDEPEVPLEWHAALLG